MEIIFSRLVNLAELRWRIGPDYQEPKQGIGLGYFEGRGRRGFHHHATFCITANKFFIFERATVPYQNRMSPHATGMCLYGVQRAICSVRSGIKRRKQGAKGDGARRTPSPYDCWPLARLSAQQRA